MKCLVVAVVLALGATANTDKFSKQDLKKALASSKNLWTVERNFERDDEGGPVSCVYDERVSLEDDKYQFIHHYKVGGARIQLPLYGSLEEEKGNVVLYVKRNKEDKGNQHVLRALDKEKNCFILTYKNATSNVEQCSLHVPEEIVFSEGSAGAQCTKLYDQTCTEGIRRNIYNNECRENRS
uniref:Lipocalin/cytosolic fatty-acid binding domain-containing protein n=1 Tax=Amblyomma maculatum TaxID=34609 RepID=G3ML39_AMBMU